MTGSTRLDLRYAWRSLRHQPSFLVTSVAVLAIGIAAVTVTLFATSAADPLTYLGVSALLLAVALTACLYPARSAVRTNPSVALRRM